eukprot:TRINITY_DN15716_c0_g1_i1.p1 TRINITY_DN15716_c0_g1~~TRINITY_DN15716_c0_g1_i1.p1  ORF type:complete len:410 (+),score=47.00 TRINITY_DN15716_c0_g1_i1:89-1318(+)
MTSTRSEPPLAVTEDFKKLSHVLDVDSCDREDPPPSDRNFNAGQLVGLYYPRWSIPSSVGSESLHIAGASHRSWYAEEVYLKFMKCQSEQACDESGRLSRAHSYFSRKSGCPTTDKDVKTARDTIREAFGNKDGAPYIPDTPGVILGEQTDNLPPPVLNLPNVGEQKQIVLHAPAVPLGVFRPLLELASVQVNNSSLMLSYFLSPCLFIEPLSEGGNSSGSGSSDSRSSSDDDDAYFEVIEDTDQGEDGNPEHDYWSPAAATPEVIDTAGITEESSSPTALSQSPTPPVAAPPAAPSRSHEPILLLAEAVKESGPRVGLLSASKFPEEYCTYEKNTFTINVQESGGLQVCDPVTSFPSAQMEGISFVSGKWYYEMYLGHCGGVGQVGWVDRKFMQNPMVGNGVGDCAHS